MILRSSRIPRNWVRTQFAGRGESDNRSSQAVNDQKLFADLKKIVDSNLAGVSDPARDVRETARQNAPGSLVNDVEIRMLLGQVLLHDRRHGAILVWQKTRCYNWSMTNAQAALSHSSDVRADAPSGRFSNSTTSCRTPTGGSPRATIFSFAAAATTHTSPNCGSALLTVAEGSPGRKCFVT
jgi:hypothetical protein